MLSIKKFGKAKLQILTKRGVQIKKYQRFRCHNCLRVWYNKPDDMMDKQITPKMLNWIGFVYLRSLSLYNTVEIVRSYFEKDYLSKDLVLKHLEDLADILPSITELTAKLKPARSGYYAFDGMWFKYAGEERVLIICFDVVTIDLVDYLIATDENYNSYSELFDSITKSEPNILSNAKGFYSDGELGLLKIIRERYSDIPLQLCVFHKYTRSNQIIPFVRAKGINKIIKHKIEKVLFASSKDDAIQALNDLKRYAQEHHENERLKKIVGVLRRNFHLLLTHFDNPEMSPYNNVLEGFNHIIKRRIRLMKGFKKELNIERWFKLILIDYRFHQIHSSKFPGRNGSSPLELAEVDLPKYHNWITLVRKIFRK